MNWHYAVGGQQQGPVDDAQLDALIQSGQINPETLVWREGMANWQPLRQARPSLAASAAPPVYAAPASATGPQPTAPDQVVCAECGNIFTKDNAIQYGATWVCAGCKPVFLQKLREGAPLASSSGSFVSEEDLLAREYRVEIGEYVERAWKVVIGNFGLVAGASILVSLVAIAGWLLSTAVSLVIPFANVLLSGLYTGPLLGGYMWFLLRLTRGEQPGVGDAFAGFSRQGAQLMLCSLIQGLLNIACLLPMFIIGIIAGLATRRATAPGNIDGGLMALLVLFVLVGVAALVYLNTIWTHSLLLVIDKGYGFWPAMQLSRRLVGKRWWMTFLFLFIGGILSGIGALACIVGLLVSGPLYYGMRVAFYEDNFRDLASPAGRG